MPGKIEETRTLRRAFAFSSLLLLSAVIASGCFSARHHSPEARQENFGVDMARRNLWREALFRFQRAVELSPNDAMAHNNLAVAFEANGEFDKAAKEYREAMRLDKTNQYIQKNYSRFVEFTSRNKKRQQRKEQAETKTASAAATPPAAPTAAPPQPPPSVQPPAAAPQPTGTAPAAVPPEAAAPPPPAAPAPTDTATPPQPKPPAKPPGDQP